MSHVDSPVIAIDRLRVGQYVHLDLKWFEHPFAFGHFKIKSEEQIATLRDLGLKTVRISPELGDPPATLPVSAAAVSAAAVDAAATVQAATVPGAAPDLSPVMRVKRAMMEEMKARREDAPHGRGPDRRDRGNRR